MVSTDRWPADSDSTLHPNQRKKEGEEEREEREEGDFSRVFQTKPMRHPGSWVARVRGWGGWEGEEVWEVWVE